jgi:hypothetical protein
LRVAGLAVAALLGACGHAVRTQGTEPAGVANDRSTDQTVTATGVIYLAGSEPAALLTLKREAGAPLFLHGALASELRRLSGARVEVRGVPAPASAGPGEGLTVQDYSVLEIDGRRPHVGVLTTAGGAVRLGDANGLLLADPDGRLAALSGAKVWVVADSTVAPARVLSYGVLREPAR